MKQYAACAAALLVLFGACTDDSGGTTTTTGQPTTASTSVATGPAESGCVDFSEDSNGTVLGPSFHRAGIGFTDFGTPESFVDDIDSGVHGLWFGRDGIRVRLLSAPTEVTLEVGSWTPAELTISGIDGSANVLDQTVIPGDNSLHTVTLSGAELVTVNITGGDNESILVSLCWRDPVASVSSGCVDFS